MTRIAVIVTTYNRPDALSAVLEGYLCQSDTDFELIVADDGSTDETRKLIGFYQKKAPFFINTVWHEDRGFRAGAIRNLAVSQTDAPYIIFTDGDCIPCKDFVLRHRELMEKGYFLAGNRLLLSREFTDEILAKKIPLHLYTWIQWLKARLQGKINRLLPLMKIPGFFRKKEPKKWAGVKTCNLSVWREDLVGINGFDESYSGWGLEDSDLVIRLIRHGIKHKSARFAAPVFHLWHKENDRTQLPENKLRLDQLLKSDTVFAGQGLDRYPK